MRILVCGSRHWGVKDGNMDITCLDFLILKSVISGFVIEEGQYSGEETQTITIIEGGANGADACAAYWAKTNQPFKGIVEGDKVEHIQYPADWAQYGRAAGPIRNKQMLTDGKPEIVFAFSHDLQKSSGTKNMVELARKAGTPVYVIG